jgi:ABC-type polysaccharide/polyol phosphate transport system ATPase subunit
MRADAPNTLVDMREVSLRVLEQPPSIDRLAKEAWGRLCGRRAASTAPESERVLLDRVTFRIGEGDRIGIIGPNGAGKSTLLRVLGRIYPITSGDLSFSCRPTGLFSAGAGLMPLATGIENIYLKCMNLGMSRREIDGVVDDIVAFSDLGAHIHRPIQNYSTGMRLRLAISISLTLKPDLLLLDEWIGAAEETFREKVRARLERIIDESRGFVLTSHSEELLRRVCGRGVVMSSGRIVFDASIGDALAFYKASLEGNESLPEAERVAG